MNLHYGCGMDLGEGWYNCDASPTVWLQRLPVLGGLFKKVLKPCFPEAVHYGNIVRGIKLPPDSCDAIYCSHILEHLSLEDFKIALRNTCLYLKPSGTFRLLVPDFWRLVEIYQANPSSDALSTFLRKTCLGREKRVKLGFGLLREILGNTHHLWMWDEKGMIAELQEAGFTRIRRCEAGDSDNKDFLSVENLDRFENGLAMECSK